MFIYYISYWKQHDLIRLLHLELLAELLVLVVEGPPHFLQLALKIKQLICANHTVIILFPFDCALVC